MAASPAAEPACATYVTGERTSRRNRGKSAGRVRHQLADYDPAGLTPVVADPVARRRPAALSAVGCANVWVLVSDASAHGGDVCGLRWRGVYLRLQIQATATMATP
jgi:hypothetical protein